VPDALLLAVELGRGDLVPGHGRTRALWSTLSDIAASDLAAARAVEPHLDAVAILRQAGDDALVGSNTWGVFAAEGGDDPLRYSDGKLAGTKPWCSLADRLDFALVSAQVDGERGLFAVDLRASGVHVDVESWHARGLTEIPSGPVRFENVPAVAVGAPGWYLSRPGFFWGAIGVAACWHGGAVGIGRTVFSAMRDRPNPHGLSHLGVIDELLESNRRALDEAAARVDDGSADRTLSKRVRASIARSVEEILQRAGRALGPAPLALDAGHTKRVADLQLYVRQYHAERDEQSLGEAILRSGSAPW
jgi:alkylation response protein AidB-like acyl-CoA dehydrogenase